MSDFESYAIRLHHKAIADIDGAYQQLATFSGEEFADDWQDGLWAAISSLATLLKRRPLADENRLFQNDIWVYTYQFRKSRVIYRVLFEAVEKDEDAPYIHVLHIRHAARKPMTRAEAREIEKDEQFSFDWIYGDGEKRGGAGAGPANRLAASGHGRGD